MPTDQQLPMPRPRRRATALLIPSPWSGDEHDPIPWTYWVWYWLYRTTRVARHRFGAHDWDATLARCTWCGKVRNT